MRPCPPPKGDLLPLRKRAVLEVVLDCLNVKEYKKSQLDPLVPKLVYHWAETCQTDEDFQAWLDELTLWVRWYRAPGLWLAYIFQHVTRERSLYHLAACNLYSDAQAAYADDLCLNSLETTLSGLVQNHASLGAALQPVEDCILRKLHRYYQYYYNWCRPFGYMDCNPCTQHIYMDLSASRLCTEFVEGDRVLNLQDAEALRRVIGECTGSEQVYYGILARKFLGLLLEARAQYAESAVEFRAALELALQYKLDTEIGHLHRLYGCALRNIKDFVSARAQFEQALAYEKQQPLEPAYWQALSARELGDTVIRLAGALVTVPSGRQPGTVAVSVTDPESLRPALEAYRESRRYFDRHICVQSLFPVARAAKQQIFRSFSENAIRVAVCLNSGSDLLAESEVAGPREATEVAAGIAAAREMNPVDLGEFRANRACLYRELNTVPGTFEEYCDSLARHWDGRRDYLVAAIRLAGQRIQTQSSDEVVARLLKLQLPDTVFLLFHIGQSSSTAILVDMASGTLAPFGLSFGEQELLAVHQKYITETARRSPIPREVALENVLLAYEQMLAPVLVPVSRFLSGKHLKIFPRLQMNAVPLHALRVGGRYLADYCDISYGQTLGLFLETHTVGNAPQQSVDLGVVLGHNVPWYEKIMDGVSASYGSRAVVHQQPAWADLRKDFSQRPVRDILFACHGSFLADNPAASYLQLSGHETVGFAQLFEHLDLRGCRSVIMGACESGLVRADVGAEYIGLPGAMLASGVRYVVGALWQVNELATVVLVNRYLELIREGTLGLPAALCRAQRELMVMPRDDLAGWVDCRLRPASQEIKSRVQQKIFEMGEHPFAHPCMWAGLQIVGDV